MHSSDPLDSLNSLNHHDFNTENISTVESMSDFATDHGLNLNYQDCQTHNYHTDEGLNNLDYGSQPYTQMAEVSYPSIDTNAGMDFNYGHQDFSYTQTAEASYSSIDTNAGMDFNYGHQDFSYTQMAEASYSSMDVNTGMDFNYGTQSLGYADPSEVSLGQIDPHIGTVPSYGSPDLHPVSIENPFTHDLESHLASPRSTAPDYQEAQRQAEWHKFNTDMATSLADEGSFSRAADYQDRANDNQKKINEILGS